MPASHARPAILMITRNLPPLTGGMERLLQNAAFGLNEWSDLTIIGPHGCSSHCPPGVKTIQVSASLFPFLIHSMFAALKLCRSQKFDLALGGSGLVSPVLWLLKKTSFLDTAIFVHGLDLVVESRIYQALFVPPMKQMDRVIANSRNTRELAIGKGIPKERITVVHPGTDLPVLNDLVSRELFCAKHSLGFTRIILFTGRMTRRKGLSAFIEKSLPTILENTADCGLVVVGDNPVRGLSRSGEKAQVLEAVARRGLQKQVIFLGSVSDEDLVSAYASAAVQVFPLIEVPGDVEGFGMVAIEAASCGTPTVAFDVGGVSDAITEANGTLISPGDYERMAATVSNFINTSPISKESCIHHAKKYAWSIYNRKIRTVLSPDRPQESLTEP